ncbi:MAG: J domain-containing protein [Clostridium sp.]|jgi:hypothetical protein|nr:J domain-containing protein [Clostridium sp.]
MLGLCLLVSGNSFQYDEIKRRIRKLKKLEIQIRFDSIGLERKPNKSDLVWDEFFDLHEVSTGRARYTIHSLSAMNKEEYRSVIDEFFFHVYYRFYKENGIDNINIYNPDILSQLDLPIDAGYKDIKKKFRELAMKYHPDTGGDASKFIRLIENYRKLIDKGK